MKQDPDWLSLLQHGARTLRELAQASGWAVGPLRAAADEAVAHGLLRWRHNGAHDYLELAAPGPVAGKAVPDAHELAWARPSRRDLRHTRSCYGHLAGELGVAQLQALLRRGLLQAGAGAQLEVTPAGRQWLADWNIPPGAELQQAPGCLDWSQRRDHLGGALGRALLEHHLLAGWLQAGSQPRSLQLTERGRREFLPWLQLA